MTATIDRSRPITINRDHNVRQVCYVQDDNSGYGAVEVWNSTVREWREITGHELTEVEVEKFLEAVVL